MRVLIWLGEPDNPSRDPFEFQEDLFREARAARVAVQGTANDMGSHDSIEQVIYGGWSPMMGSPVAVAFRDLFEKPWFTRSWIVQEVALASDAVVCCGSYHTAFTRFDRASSVMKRIGWPTPTSMDLVRLVRSQKSTIEAPYRLDLANLLYLSHKLEAKLPHDKVYALLGLVADGDDPAYTPNYEDEINIVYHRAAAHMITTSNSADILACVCWPKNLEKLPSWVPDWTCPPQASQPFTSTRSGLFLHRVVVSDGRLITLGRRLDTVFSIGSYTLETDWYVYGPSGNDVAAQWDEMITIAAQAHSMPFDLVKRKLFIAVNTESAIDEERTTRLYNACFFKPVADSSRPAFSQAPWRAEYRYMCKICAGRAAMLTARNKYLVLGPVGVRVGDVVWQLTDGDLCFILRPGILVDTWILIGACYLQIPSAGLTEESLQPLVIV